MLRRVDLQSSSVVQGRIFLTDNVLKKKFAQKVSFERFLLNFDCRQWKLMGENRSWIVQLFQRK